MFDLFREIYQTLRNNKLRTALTGFAVAWGIFMLIVLLGMGRGVKNGFEGSRGNAGTNVINVWGGRTTKAYQGFREGREIQLKSKDMTTVKDEVKNTIDEVTTYIRGGSTTISSPLDYISTNYCGVYPTYLEMRGHKIQEGRFINGQDLELNRKVIVITRKNARVLFKDSTKVIGSKLTMNNLSFTIVGVYDPEWGEDVFIPYTTAKMLNGNSDDIDNLTITIKNVKTQEDGENTEKEIRATLAATHTFDPEDDNAVWIWNRFTQYLSSNEVLNILQIVIWIIGLFTMLSGIVGVGNIMFVSVRERTHEIGIRRAIGARPHHIVTQILTESIAITTLFGYIGIFFGILVTEGLSIAFASFEGIKDPTVDISIAINVTLVLILAGSLAGLFPALRALKVKPVEALRDE